LKIPEIKLRYWMGRGELAKLARALHNYWGHVKAVFEMPLQQHDPLIAPMALVNILAWQRGVEKLGQEPKNYFVFVSRMPMVFPVMRGLSQVGKICLPNLAIRISPKMKG